MFEVLDSEGRRRPTQTVERTVGPHEPLGLNGRFASVCDHGGRASLRSVGAILRQREDMACANHDLNCFSRRGGGQPFR